MQLRKAGFVADVKTVRNTQRPERTVYALTDEGRHEVYDWLHQLVAQPHHEYPLFGVALSLLSVLPPAEAVELLAQRQAVLGTEIDEIRTALRASAESGVAWVFLIEEEYRLAVLDAESRFIEGLVESLKDPEYVRAWREFFSTKETAENRSSSEGGK